MTLAIRPATRDDHAAIWAVLEPVVRSGETFAWPRDLTRDGALALWLAPDADVFVADDQAAGVVGSYFIRPNQRGGGAHVANGGYATAPVSRGKGVARQMCAHSIARSGSAGPRSNAQRCGGLIEQARARGFRALQYNFVIATNEPAVALWQAMGMAIVGRLPGAFRHPTLGYVDALVMYRDL